VRDIILAKKAKERKKEEKREKNKSVHGMIRSKY
jgi:hypothetical protein